MGDLEALRMSELLALDADAPFVRSSQAGDQRHTEAHKTASSCPIPPTQDD